MKHKWGAVVNKNQTCIVCGTVSTMMGLYSARSRGGTYRHRVFKDGKGRTRWSRILGICKPQEAQP